MALKLKLANLTSAPIQNGDEDRKMIVAFGGFDGWSIEDAKQWVIDTLWENYGPQPEKMYSKGDTFRGMLFGKFSSEADRDRVVSKFKTLKKSIYGKEIRATNDMPIEKRMCKNILF